MLDWLKTILGDIYTEDIDKQVSAEIGKGFVAKGDFNAINDEKKKLKQDVETRDNQIAELKKADPEKLQETIATLQKQNADDKADYEQQLRQTRIDAAVDRELATAKAKNMTATKALLSGFLSEAELDDKGNIKGLTEAVKGLVEGNDTSFLFDVGSSESFKPSGASPADGKDGTPNPQISGYQSRLAEARKVGDNLAAVQVKQEAANEGIILI